MAEKRIVAVALLTQSELNSLGATFDRAFPVEEMPCFGELLAAIDTAEREVWRERDATFRGSTSDGAGKLSEI